VTSASAVESKRFVVLRREATPFHTYVVLGAVTPWLSRGERTEYARCASKARLTLPLVRELPQRKRGHRRERAVSTNTITSSRAETVRGQATPTAAEVPP